MQIVSALLCLLFFMINYVQGQAQTNLSRKIDSFLMTQFKPDEPGGVVLVAKNGNVLYKKAFGMADLELNVPVNDSMIFYIGSNTKQFTAVAILQLVEKNKLHLQDTLGKFIAGAPYPVSSITLRQLLSHTSGLTEKNEAIINKLLKGQKIENFISTDIVPGKKWEYSNTGYGTLGFIIEKITGKPYGEYIRENILKPAGMVHSFVDDNASIIKNRADGYAGPRQNNYNSRPTAKMGAAGGIMSTAEDMLQWTQALQSGILLKPETLQLAYTPQKLSDGSVTDYGMGWYLQELHGSATRRHGGRTAGYVSETLYFPQEGVYVIILTNTADPGFPIGAVTRIIAGMAINKPYIFEDQPIDKNELKTYIGLYENELGELVNISQEEGKLIWQRTNGGKAKLGFAGNNEFFFDKDFYRLNFNNDAAGKTTSLTFSKVDILPRVWFKTQRPLLKLAPEKIPVNILEGYSGKYFLPGADTITITHDERNLFYKVNDKEFLLVAKDSTHFYALKDDISITFTKERVANVPALTITQNKKNKQYLKL
jgi:CubicO group peptidase (beta-lactamase class C family)